MVDLDPRIVRIGLLIGDNLTFYEGLSIYASGTKFTSTNQGQAVITILNLKRDTREQLMQAANPFNSNPQRKSVIVEVGRVSYGASILYQGDIFRVQPSGKPDIGVSLKCLTGYYDKRSILSRTFGALSSLSEVAKQAALDNGLSLSFEIQDKNIGAYTFTGSAFQEIVNLESLALSDVFVDNGTLYVKEAEKQKTGATIKVLNKNTGMVGIPEGTENGVRVSMLYDPVVQIGGRIRLTSEINPVLDGDYIVYMLEFDITSRDNPFYLHAECRRLNS